MKTAVVLNPTGETTRILVMRDCAARFAFRSMLRIFGVVALWLVLGCGNGKEAIDVREKLKAAQDKVEVMSASISSDQIDAMNVVEQCRKDLEEARGLIIEGNLKRAREIIDQVMTKTNPPYGREDTDTSNGRDMVFGDVFGDVQAKKPGADTFEKLSMQSVPKPGMEIKTGIRSNLLFYTFGGSAVHLHAQSLLELNRIRSGSGIVDMVLRSGYLTYQQKEDFGGVNLTLQGVEFGVTSAAVLEFGSDPISQYHYAAVHRGGIQWRVTGGDEGFLAGNSALVWKGSERKTRRLPLAPLTDSPANHFGFQIDPSTGKASVQFRWHSMDVTGDYQLQVSKSPIFATRVYDNRNLDAGGVDLELGPGTYYWRVRGIVDKMVPGAFSPVNDFFVREGKVGGTKPSVQKKKKARKGPRIAVPKIELIGKVAIVSGKSHPDATVTVNGVRAVMLEDGNFSVIVNFMREGEQWIEIVARDKSGGETVSRHKVRVAF